MKAVHLGCPWLSELNKFAVLKLGCVCLSVCALKYIHPLLLLFNALLVLKWCICCSHSSQISFFVPVCVSACLSVWQSLLNTLLFSICVFISVSQYGSLSFSVQSVQIELACYDASGILISSNLHLDNGRSWEAISLLFFLSFPLLEPPIPPSCASASVSLPTAPATPPLLCFWGRWVSWETRNKGWKGSLLDSRLKWVLLDFICAPEDTALLIMNFTHLSMRTDTQTHTHSYVKALYKQPAFCRAVCP